MTFPRISMTPRQLMEFTRLAQWLPQIVLDGLGAWPLDDMIVSCIWRTAAEEAAAGGKSGIHVAGPPYRALDASMHNHPNTSTEVRWEACMEVASAVNKRWIYDPARPTMLVAFAAPHGTGPHVHFQVHPNTKERGQL